jgi:hypothetical protein
LIFPDVPVAPAPQPPTLAEKRALMGKFAGNLKQTHTLAANKNWDALGHHVAGEFHGLDLPKDLRQALDALPALGQQLKTLARVEGLLAAGSHLDFPEASALPPPLKKSVDEVASLDRLKSALSTRWGQKPDAAVLGRDLAVLAAAANDPALTTHVQLALARKAAQEGHAEVAEKLLPPGHTVRDLTRPPAVKESASPGPGQPPPPGGG